MDDFLTKPVRMPDLLAAMDRVAKHDLPPVAADSVLTPSAVLAACENDASLLEKLCGMFRERAPEHLAALSAARWAGDLAGLRETAHKLAGMVAVFSTPTGELASRIEELAEAGELPAASELVTGLETAVTTLIQLTGELSLERLLTYPSQNSSRE
jgi:HPt (histidine-containing phosphotransfer) domain-containing protein